MATIKVISFDLDDTLWDNPPVLKQAEQAVFDFLTRQHPAFGQQFDIPSLQLLKQGIAARRPELADQVSELRIVSLETALQQTAYAGDARDLAEQAFAVFIHWRHQVQLLPDVERVLEQLAQDYQLAALTNGNAEVERLAIAKHFSYAQNAERLGVKKPEAEYYQRALDALSVTPEQVIHIGDHPHHDVDAARALGMHTIWVDLGVRRWPEDLAPPSRRATAIDQLPELIQQLASS